MNLLRYRSYGVEPRHVPRFCDEDFLDLAVGASDFLLEISRPGWNVLIELAELVDAINEPECEHCHENETATRKMITDEEFESEHRHWVMD